MDAELKRLLGALDKRDELDDTLVVVTSDHGEGFGEPSHLRPGIRVAEHGVAIHDVLLHVPLLVHYPGQESSVVVSEPASLTEFPNVVSDLRDHGAETATFVPDGPVLASAVGLDQPLQERAGEYVDDLSPWMNVSRAVFDTREDDDASVLKYCTSGDRKATLAVRDAQSSWELPSEDASIVADVFAELDDANVREAGDGVENLDEGTYERLSDLGYV